MSLLLDALKKAALDKQHRDQLAYSRHQEEPPPATQTPAPVAPDLNLDLNPDPDPDEKIFGTAANRFDEEEFLIEDYDFAEPEEPAAVASPRRPAELSLVDTQPQSAQPFTLKDTPPAESPADPPPLDESPLEKVLRRERETAAKNSAGEPDLQPFATAAEPVAAPVGAAAAPELSLQSEGPSFARIGATEDQERKAALALLLTKSQGAARRARRRSILLLSVLSLCVCTVIGFYSYYLLINHQTSAVLSPASLATGATPEESAPEAEDPVPADSETAVATGETGVVADTGETGGDISGGEMPAPPTSASAPISPPASANAELSGGAFTAPVPAPPRTAPTGAEKAPVAAAAPAKPVTAARDGSTSVGATPKPTSVVEPMAPVTAASAPTARTGSGTVTETIRIARGEPVLSPVDAAVRAGFDAYQQGDMAVAATEYERALKLAPHNRDALLGAAAVATRQGNRQLALRYYQQRLNRTPRDEYARAGLLALASADAPDRAMENEVGRMLREFPEAAHLHFLKGSLSAARGDWPAAQEAFFEAWRWDKTQADYAFNLAVSLDHLQQPAEALRLYQEALRLAGGPESFDRAGARQRIAQLETRLR